MTIDQLALATEKEFQIIHKEFRALREEMAEMRAEFATKEEMRQGFEEMNRSIGEIRHILESFIIQVSAYMARTNEDISKLQAVDRDVDVRLRVVEKRG